MQLQARTRKESEERTDDLEPQPHVTERVIVPPKYRAAAGGAVSLVGVIDSWVPALTASRRRQANHSSPPAIASLPLAISVSLFPHWTSRGSQHGIQACSLAVHLGSWLHLKILVRHLFAQSSSPRNNLLKALRAEIRTASASQRDASCRPTATTG